MSRKYFVYILTNYKNSILYIGITNSLERRVFEHKNHLNPDSFTAKYRLYKLIWFQEFEDVRDAILVEKKIKGWNRNKKINLIKEMNINFIDLFTLR
ncbi:MAG: GIY-YIG nuclease family protein [Candidatus Shapirobacteria bacterium]|nr:GIY-YIG nuclease family protein [Candidatus Shapirobacteria bacterium]